MQQTNAVFLKLAMIHDNSLEEGQCSKEKDLLDDEMNIDLDEGPDKEKNGGANKGKKRTTINGALGAH